MLSARTFAALTTRLTTRRGAALLLALLMLPTREFHFGPLPDASWAVFYLGGLFVGGGGAFAAFMAAAVLSDYIATQHLGVSSYCLSPAYVFLLPSYAALWWGGVWTARHAHPGQPRRGLVLLIAGLLVSFTACFLLSNGSFYWLGGRVAAPSVAGWSANLRAWYGYFLVDTSVYVGGVLVLQRLAARLTTLCVRKIHTHTAPLGSR